MLKLTPIRLGGDDIRASSFLGTTMAHYSLATQENILLVFAGFVQVMSQQERHVHYLKVLLDPCIDHNIAHENYDVG